jgi:hypothetical protein
VDWTSRCIGNNTAIFFRDVIKWPAILTAISSTNLWKRMTLMLCNAILVKRLPCLNHRSVNPSVTGDLYFNLYSGQRDLKCYKLHALIRCLWPTDCEKLKLRMEQRGRHCRISNVQHTNQKQDLKMLGMWHLIIYSIQTNRNTRIRCKFMTSRRIICILHIANAYNPKPNDKVTIVSCVLCP